MWATFQNVKSDFGTAHKFSNTKKNSSSCVYVPHNTSYKNISSRNRAVAAKECTHICCFPLLPITFDVVFTAVVVCTADTVYADDRQ